MSISDLTWILAIDPGETCGFSLVEFGHPAVRGSGAAFISPIAMSFWEYSEVAIPRFSTYLRRLLLSYMPSKLDCVVVEDYRVYAAMAAWHIGQKLITPMLIGAIIAVCALLEPSIPVVLIPAVKKGLWPDAKIKAHYPWLLKEASSEHMKDALKLALTYIEGKYL